MGRSMSMRSAYEITKRHLVPTNERDTNWEAFTNNLERELTKQAGVPDTKDEQLILRATCTAKNYKLPIFN